MLRRMALAGVAIALLPASAAAQEAGRLTLLGRIDVAASIEAPAISVLPSPDLDTGTAAKLTGAGILGGAIGLFGGGYLGAWIADQDGGIDDLDVLRGMLVGATIGEAALLPAGVHLANGRRGSYWTSALVSTGLAVAGVALLEAAHWDAPAAPIIAAAVPAAQLVTSIAIERATD